MYLTSNPRDLSRITNLTEVTIRYIFKYFFPLMSSNSDIRMKTYCANITSQVWNKSVYWLWRIVIVSWRMASWIMYFISPKLLWNFISQTHILLQNHKSFFHTCHLFSVLKIWISILHTDWNKALACRCLNSRCLNSQLYTSDGTE